MTAPDTMWRVPVPPKPRPADRKLTTREAVGEFARDQLKYRGLTYKAAAAQAHNLSKSSVERIVRADPTVTTGLLITLAGVLQLPEDLLVFMLVGDVKSIRNLVGLDESRRQKVLSLLAESELPPKI